VATPPTVEAKYSIESQICIIGNVAESGLHQVCWCNLLGYVSVLRAASPKR